MKWIEIANDRIHLQVLVVMVMNLHYLKDRMSLSHEIKFIPIKSKKSIVPEFSCR